MVIWFIYDSGMVEKIARLVWLFRFTVFLDLCGIPTLLSPGNHSLPEPGLKIRLAPAFSKSFSDSVENRSREVELMALNEPA